MHLHSKRILSVLAAMLLACPSVFSAANLQIAGLAVYTDTARDIYIAGFLTPDGRPPASAGQISPPAAMQYRIATRRISDRGLSGTILLQAEVGAGQRAPEHVIDGIEKLKQHLKGALRSGDQFEIALSEAGNTVFSLNSVELLSLPGSEVFDYLVLGWIGDSASALMRDSLLSGKLNDDVMLRYESLIPLEERRQLVAGWTTGAVAEPEVPVAAPEVVEEAVAAAEPLVDEPAVDEALAAPEEEQVAVTTQPVEEEPAALEFVPDPATAGGAIVATSAVLSEVEPMGEQLAMLEPAPIIEPPMSEEEAWVSSLDDREYQQYLNEYISSVMIEVFRSVKYPKRAIKREWEGQVEVLAQVDSRGQVLDMALEATSGRDILDEAALDAVKAAAPFPELTPVAKSEFLAEDGADSYYMLIPVKFQLN